ncbi:FtsX-like permease family protein [Lacticaseibacillus kribbianus]|uniref:FtsX-like permease family protein n=1 Tax=Lacticaseibacillus kribbianus TaxID=2926292 RepID=UPI001CD44F40|nr:FtsX-like permease family protein [Lacticaseibacillus kribbianus]
MLRKLALGGIRARFRDYAVLFSGLVIASAVFYMFMTMATNKAFLASNSPISATPVIFGFGTVLLVIITTVYIVYANTFLMSMRQRDYAMFMMLGAKSGKIAQLIFLETVAVGLGAAAVGVVVGTGLTAVAGSIFLGMLHAPATHFAVLWLPAVIATFAFFLAMFVIAAFVNAARLLKTPVLNLLHATTLPNRIQQKRWVLALQAVLAVVLLAIGYWIMGKLMNFGVPAIGIALVTIVLGTYFLFNALLVWAIGLLRRNRRFAARGLHTFTLGQLSFRLRDYTKILAVVAMLFALALGAITVGLGFKDAIPEMAKQQGKYDLVLMAPNASAKQSAAKLTGVAKKVTYRERVVGKTVYLNAAELDAKRLDLVLYRGPGKVVEQAVTGQNFAKYQDEGYSQLQAFKLPGEESFKVVSEAAFAKLSGSTRTAVAYQLKDIGANYDRIDALLTAQNKRYKIESADQSGQKFVTYALINSMFGGLAFMGFFLGLAFLAMLASTLMFKILSGASFDAARYLMLQKIGVRQGLLRKSVRQEIGALFAFPAGLGMVHVLFGLQMFNGLLQHPYQGLLLPFGIFLVLYAVYYGLTVWLYESIVIKKDLAA